MKNYNAMTEDEPRNPGSPLLRGENLVSGHLAILLAVDGVSVDTCSEADLVTEMKRNGYAIKCIENPSEAVCMAAVKERGTAIVDIKNPSEAVCMTAVKQNGNAIKHIKNPSDAVQMAAVLEWGAAIRYIKNPSEAVCLAAVAHSGWMIQHIKNPSEAVCLAAMNKSGQAISCIKNPSEAVQITAVKSHPEAISYLVVYTDQPVCGVVAATHLLHHPFSSATPPDIADHVEEILEAHCAGLGDIYTIGLSISMTGEDLSRTMIEWTDDHMNQVAAGEEMTP